LAEVENFTITVQHSMRTPLIIDEVEMKSIGEGVEVCDKELYEELESRKASSIPTGESKVTNRRLTATKAKPKDPNCNYFAPDPRLATNDGSPDTFRLGTLLKIAGINLDEPSKAQKSGSRRLLGTTLVLTIHYENTIPFSSFYKAFFSPLETRYRYSLDELPVDEYKARDSYWRGGWNQVERTVVEVHGIRLMVLFTGRLGCWSLTQLGILISVSFTTLLMAESIVVLFIRKSPISWESGKVKPAHLAELFYDNARDISEDWLADFKKAKDDCLKEGME